MMSSTCFKFRSHYVMMSSCIHTVSGNSIPLKFRFNLDVSVPVSLSMCHDVIIQFQEISFLSNLVINLDVSVPVSLSICTDK